MSDNRFEKYKTKRIPDLKEKKHEGYNFDALYEDNYDDDNDEFEPSHNTRPVRPVNNRRERTTHHDYSSDRPRRSNQPRVRNNSYDNDYPKRQSSHKPKLAAFYIGMLVVAVAVCIVAAFMAFQWMLDRAPSMDNLPTLDPVTIVDGDESDSAAVITRPGTDSFTAMIIGIDTNTRNLTLLDLNTTQTRQLPLYENVQISNSGSTSITLLHLRIGQLINIYYDPSELEIVAIQESSAARELTNNTNVHVNMVNSTISAGQGGTFIFNDHTLVMHNNRIVPIDDITPVDSVTIVALNNIAWFVEVNSTHGFFEVTNASHIVNGRITVGDLHPLYLDELNEPFIVTEGPHRIVVEGDNIETFIDNIIISPGQTLTLNLTTIEVNQATLNITVTPENATVFINDVQTPIDEPIQLPFEEHTIRVEHEGYETEEYVIELTAPTTSRTFNLVAVPQAATLTISATPSGAQVLINGIPAGLAAPTFTQELQPGIHTITVRADDYSDYTFHVTAALGDDFTYTINLTPRPQAPPTIITQPPQF